MDASALAMFIGRLRQLVERRDGGLDDAELLQRFAKDRDEAAFEVLLWRYGPLVLGVCRRMLWCEQDVEDAFQATFLTLVRKAGSIARRHALGSWLHQVAYRIGLRARARSVRGGILDQERVESAVARSAHEADEGWREVLDQEVQRLPRRYRTPFILCYLEGKTHAEAARLLACPPGTIASRLAWARERLRARLTARGLTLPAALACLMVPVETQANSLTVLIATALRTARMVTTGTLTGSSTIPAHVIAWSKGVVRTMFLSKVQMMATLVLASVLVGAGGGVLWQSGQAGESEAVSSEEPAAETNALPQQKSKVSRPPAEEKGAVARDVERMRELDRLRDEFAKAEDDYHAIEQRWDHRMAAVRRELWEQEGAARAKKARVAFEAKRTARALEMAESRYEKLTHALDTIIDGDVMIAKLQKKQQEAQKQVEQLSAKLMEDEIQQSAVDEPFEREKLAIESLERQRALEVGRVRKRVEAIERKLHPATADAAGERILELERKVDALTRTLEEVRKALRR
jgi:RNA polymerase sigma factor (sigma-70 family)